MLSGVIGDEVHGNIFWPQIPYVNDENGGQSHSDDRFLYTTFPKLCCMFVLF